MVQKAVLVLADGSYFVGEAMGSQGSTTGEICFNTSMTGYQEILTDPSYSGQIVVMTYPEIGNYGVNPDDAESEKVQVAGFVVKNLCEHPSNWRLAINNGDSKSAVTLDKYLSDSGIPGLKGIDTRKLVRILREKGAQMGIIETGNYNINEVIARAEKLPSMAGQDLASKVTTNRQYDWVDSEHPINFNPMLPLDVKPLIAAFDFGIKSNILRKFKTLGAELRVVPADTTFEEIESLNPDGILLSNGPGDPEPVTYAQQTIKQLVNVYPVFGICLGHQLLCLALGGKTYKLKFGHRGANHPIKHLPTGTVAITSQNHGFAVRADSLNPAEVEITHINLNDNTVAGIRHRTLPLFSVQYHPEASPGPRDSQELFIDFIKSAGKFRQSKQTSIGAKTK